MKGTDSTIPQPLRDTTWCEQLLERCPSLAWICDEDGVVRWVNDTFTASLGWTEDAVIGQAISRFATGIDDDSQAESSLSLRHRDGTILRTTARSEAIPGSGKRLFLAQEAVLYGTQRDSLPAAEWFSAILSHLVDMLWVIDPDTTIRFASRSCQRVLGYGPGELVGVRGMEMIHPDDLDVARVAFREVVDQKNPFIPTHFRFRRADGTWAHIEALGANLLAHPNVGGLVISARDVTDRVRLEEQLRQAQKLEAVGVLAGGIAHDFNNLLSSVLTGYDLIDVRSGHTEDIKQLTDGLRKAIRRSAGLTQQLLAFSRKQSMQTDLVDLNKTVGDVLSMVARLLPASIEVDLQLHPEAVPVQLDVPQFEQVVVNLIINARDAMPNGGKITVRTGVDDPSSAGEVRLEVQDDGPGIAPSVMAHLFEPFFTTKPRGRGTGLGLAVVYGTVKRHHGSVEVRSEVDKGTTFTVRLPRAGVELGEEVEARDGPEQALTGHETILLVEDEPTLRVFIAKALAHQGYEVIEAGSGQHALALELERRPDLLLCDIIMPGLNGWLLYQRFAARYPGLPALFISGYADDVLRDHKVDPDDIAVVKKPFSLHELTRALRRVLDAAPSATRAGVQPRTEG